MKAHASRVSGSISFWMIARGSAPNITRGHVRVIASRARSRVLRLSYHGIRACDLVRNTLLQLVLLWHSSWPSIARASAAALRFESVRGQSPLFCASRRSACPSFPCPSALLQLTLQQLVLSLRVACSCPIGIQITCLAPLRAAQVFVKGPARSPEWVSCPPGARCALFGTRVVRDP